jgi:hypothetical protein
MKKIGIIDADLISRSKHRFPNLACMKISGYHKKMGYDVKLITDYKKLYYNENIWVEYQNALYEYRKEQNEYTNKVLAEKMIPCFQKENIKYDKLFISKVFTDTEVDEDFLQMDIVEYGGTGFFYDKAPFLPNEIEHSFPDYNLYNTWVAEKIEEGGKKLDFQYYTDYSIGFTTRFCFRQCGFCVNKNYKKVDTWSPLSEFVDEARKYICLLDDNMLGNSQWKNILSSLQESKKPFQYKQGLDPRLLTEEKINLLFNKCKYKGDYIFAFDNIEDADLIEEKLKLIRKHFKNTSHNIKFYVFCGFDREDKWDLDFWRQDLIDTFKRVEILMKYKCLPYIMRFNRYEKSPYKGTYINLASWCNQPSFFKKLSYRQFCEVNQARTKTKICAAMQYLNQIEKEIPNVAKEYFNLKF